MLVLFSLSQSLDFLVMALGFWYGSQLLSTREYNITQFYVVFTSIVFSGQAAAQFFSHTKSMANVTGTANSILWLRAMILVMQENKENCKNAPKGDGRIL
jgi:ATP-binding cassette, subfamily B (MDR/TAP), member 1